MNWDEFCEFRTPDIAWAASRMNSNIYIGILERILVVFQHVNAIVHITGAKKTWFRGKNIEIIGSVMSDVFIDLLNILMFW